MSSFDFPHIVIDLIRRCAPNFAAAELLVYLHAHAEESWTNEELQVALKPRGFTVASINESMVRFQRCGLVEARPEKRFRYLPDSEIAGAVSLLVAAYREKPVSLIRTIYAVADDPIQSFADSFRLKPE